MRFHTATQSTRLSLSLSLAFYDIHVHNISIHIVSFLLHTLQFSSALPLSLSLSVFLLSMFEIAHTHAHTHILTYSHTYILKHIHPCTHVHAHLHLLIYYIIGLAPKIPEDLYHLIKKAVNIRRHLTTNRKDRDSKFRLILIESRIHRLARYYKRKRYLPPNWKYESATASALVA